MSPTLPTTEGRNPLSAEMDRLSPFEFVRLMNRIDAEVPLAVAEVLPQIARGIEWITRQMSAGGRLFYLGAGTSGRLGVLDATELGPTFGLASDRTVALIAGGPDAITRSVEGAEDDRAGGRSDLEANRFTSSDILIGIAASGRTPYVIGALEYARSLGAPTIALVCASDSDVAAAADLPIEVVVGPEILTGSTRLKAGSAQKMVLNMLSTGAMVQMGKVYGNLMIDVQPSNTKLVDRAKRIIGEVTGLDPEAAAKMLEASGGSVKTATVMTLANLDADTARTRLKASGGQVRPAIEG